MGRGRAAIVGISAGLPLLVMALIFGGTDNPSIDSLDAGTLLYLGLALPHWNVHGPSPDGYTTGIWVGILLMTLLTMLVAGVVASGLKHTSVGRTFFVAWGSAALAAPLSLGIGGLIAGSSLDNGDGLSLGGATENVLGNAHISGSVALAVVFLLSGAVYAILGGAGAGLLALILAAATSGMDRNRAPYGQPWNGPYGQAIPDQPFVPAAPFDAPPPHQPPAGTPPQPWAQPPGPPPPMR